MDECMRVGVISNHLHAHPNLGCAGWPRERVLTVDFGLMSFSATLLFALPTMRGMLPAVASAGTRFDVINIYGQLCLITACIAIQAVKILYTVVTADGAKEAKDAAAPGAAAACRCGMRSAEAATVGV